MTSDVNLSENVHFEKQLEDENPFLPSPQTEAGFSATNSSFLLSSALSLSSISVSLPRPQLATKAADPLRQVTQLGAGHRPAA